MINETLVLPGDYPDPSILKDGADYWMTHSSFKYAPGLLIWHSRDLSNWEPVAHGLSRFGGDVWAPELTKHQGRYFIYFKTTGGNHVVHAERPSGPWSEPIPLQLGYIDPGHIVGEDGRRFLHLSDGMLVELSDDGLSCRGEPRKILEAWPMPNDRLVEGLCLEGPKLFWHEGWCHLLVAQGGTAGPATSHGVVHARARSPEGPFQYSPHNPLIATRSRAERWWSRGHGTVVEGPDGRWHCFYHAYDRDAYGLGRQTLMTHVEWTEDGWLKRPEDSTEGALPAPALENFSSWSDPFTGPTLSWRWRFWGSHGEGRYRFEDDGGLRLEARGDSLSENPPMTCIAATHSYEIEIDFTIEGDALAALLLFYNDEHSGGIAVGRGRAVKLTNGRLTRIAEPLEARQGSIRLVNDAHEVAFWIRSEGAEWKRFFAGFETSGWHHNAFGGFLSLRPALAALGNGAVVFHRFRYRA